MKTAKASRVGEVPMHNPGKPPTWPGERTRNMATKKKGKGGKKGNRNSASVKQTRPAANKTATRNTAAKPKTHGKGGKGRRNGGGIGGFLRNTFGGQFGGIGIPDVVGAGGGVLVGEAGAAVLPQSYIGDVLLFLGAVLTAKGMSSFSVTKPFARGAGIGVGAVAFKNGLNRVTNGAVTNFFTGITTNVRGYLQPAPQQQQQLPAGGNGNAGMGRVVYPSRFKQAVW